MSRRFARYSRRSPTGRVWITAAATTRSPACSRTSTRGPSTWLRRRSGPAASTAGCAHSPAPSPTASSRTRRVRTQRCCASTSCLRLRRRGESARTGGGPHLVVVPRVISGRDDAAVAAARDELRSELAFLYSTPAYQRTLELFGLHRDRQPASATHARRKEWSALAGVLTDDVVSQLVPQGTYAELPDVLASWYDRMCDGIALDMPSDPGRRPEFAAMIDRIKSIPARVSWPSRSSPAHRHRSRCRRQVHRIRSWWPGFRAP